MEDKVKLKKDIISYFSSVATLYSVDFKNLEKQCMLYWNINAT